VQILIERSFPARQQRNGNVNLNIACLTNSHNSAGALIFHCWVPPPREMNHVIGVSERKPDTTRTGRKNHHVELIWTNLEAVNSRLSGGAVDTTVDDHCK
jgi:hypothetical protein